jgi:hypothetical protein
VALYVVQQTRHLSEEILRRSDLQEVRLGGIEIANRAFQPRPIEGPPRPTPSTLGGLPCCLQVSLDCLQQTVIAIR